MMTNIFVNAERYLILKVKRLVPTPKAQNDSVSLLDFFEGLFFYYYY